MILLNINMESPYISRTENSRFDETMAGAIACNVRCVGEGCSNGNPINFHF